MRLFYVDTPQDALDDLHRTLAATRWPDEIPETGWERGAPLGYLKELAEYWRTGYDRGAVEKRSNRFPPFITEIDGADVHFLHIRSAPPFVHGARLRRWNSPAAWRAGR